jgi:predicted phosphodiesterase
MDEQLKRFEGESIEEYQMRLSVMKLREGYDIDWQEIKELLNSDEHIDTLRRKGYGLAMAYDLYEDKINRMTEEYYLQVQQIRDRTEVEIEDKRIKELQNKVLQLKVEKEKLKNERNHVNAQVRVMARVSHLIECVKADIIELNEKRPLITKEIIKGENKRDAIMLVSDIHIGAGAENILDIYNPEICRLKMNYYIDKCIERINKEKPQVIHFLCGGDLISGIIHTTTRFDNRLDVAEQVTFASELISEAIAKVRRECKLPMKVAILSGNHDRIIADKNQHIEEENFVKFIAEFVKLRLQDDKGIEFYKQEDPTLINMEIRGYKCVLVHGDKDRRNTIHRLIEMNKTVYDYIFQGHFHKYAIEPHNHTTVITNGAFGGETYARNARLYDKPIQLLMFFDDNGLESTYPINLEGYKKNK